MRGRGGQESFDIERACWSLLRICHNTRQLLKRNTTARPDMTCVFFPHRKYNRKIPSTGRRGSQQTSTTGPYRYTSALWLIKVYSSTASASQSKRLWDDPVR